MRRGRGGGRSFDKLRMRFDKLRMRFDKLRMRFDKLRMRFDKLRMRPQGVIIIHRFTAETGNRLR
jgi:hypothetical protein